MKYSHYCLSILLCLILLTACTNTNSTNSSNSLAPTTPSQVESLSTNAVSETPEAPPTPSEPEVISVLKQASELTENINRLGFTSYSADVTNYFSYDENNIPLERVINSSYYGDMTRDSQVGHILIYDSVLEFDTSDPANYNLLEEYYVNYEYYTAKDLGLYYANMEDGMWFVDALSDEYKTIEHLEDLIAFFLQYPDQVELTRYNGFSLEGEEMELKSIELKLSNDQFVEHTSFLKNTYFNGSFDKSHYEDQTYYIMSTELVSYYVALVFDNKNNVVEYHVNFEGKPLEGGDEKYMNVLTVYFSYDAADPIVVPTEVIENATPHDAY